MILPLLLLSTGILGFSSLVCAMLFRQSRASLLTGTVTAVAGCGLGAVVSIAALLGVGGATDSMRIAWTLPVGEIHIGLDPLSAFFLLCVFLVSGLSALYGAGYLAPYFGKRNLAPAAASFNLLAASMAMLLLARDGVLFLAAWEIMSLSSFFLVTFERNRAEVRRAGMVYLIASQLGALFLFLFFGLLGRGAGNYDFDRFAATLPPAQAGIAFGLALVGFGTKAGFWPLHVWLPDAHPAAPSHVSAVMSGVMTSMGIYGLIRTFTFLGSPAPWWGGVMIAIGLISALAGVLQASVQKDLKRLLAYSTVENAGIAALAIGLGLLGTAFGKPVVAQIAFCGALLHVLNHGLFKSLLFQAAGSAVHATGTRDINSLGGLLKRMPVTGALFLLGAAAICGLPALNGFVGEFAIFTGAFIGSASLPAGWNLAAVVIIVGLALAAGIAIACFTKAFGISFLGQARSEAARTAHECGAAMKVAMAVTASLCVTIGLWPAAALRLTLPAAASALGTTDYGMGGVGAVGASGGVGVGASGGVGVAGVTGLPADASAAFGWLSRISLVAGVFLGLVLLLTLLRKALLADGRKVSTAGTWACGYAETTPRMQYTGSSFSQPLVEPFAAALHSRVRREGPAGYFPARARYLTETGDMAGDRFLLPAYHRVLLALRRARVLQQGRIQLYLAYIFLTLVLLLSWQLFGPGK